MADYDKLLEIHNNPKEALKHLQQAQAENKRLKAFVETVRGLVEALVEGREYEDWGAPIRAASVALTALAEGEENDNAK